MIIEKGENVSKWPKYKARLIIANPEDNIDNAVPPSPPGSDSEEEDTSELETHLPRRYESGRAQSSDIEARPDVMDEPMGISDEELETGDGQ